MLDGDRAFHRAAIIIHGEFHNGSRDSSPIYEVAPNLFLRVQLITVDQLRSDLPQIFAEVI